MVLQPCEGAAVRARPPQLRLAQLFVKRADGRGTVGLPIPKSNWAIILDTQPFEAYAVTCGLTFTFGGLKIDGSARVIDTDGQVIPGLYAAGELVGGIFYFNYPGGTGLMNGAVFGKIAGTAAGQRAAQMP